MIFNLEFLTERTCTVFGNRYRQVGTRTVLHGFRFGGRMAGTAGWARSCTINCPFTVPSQLNINHARNTRQHVVVPPCKTAIQECKHVSSKKTSRPTIPNCVEKRKTTRLHCLHRLREHPVERCHNGYCSQISSSV